jgi:type II secretory pathway component GspD/PulD (secretin)
VVPLTVAIQCGKVSLSFWNNNLMTIYRHIIIFPILLLFLNFSPAVGQTPSFSPPIGQAPSDSPAVSQAPSDAPAIGQTPSDLMTSKLSRDGRVSVIPIDPDNLEAAKDLLQKMQGRFHDIAAEIYTPVGLLPRVVILGEPPKVQQMSAVMKEMFLQTGTKHMVIISATLHEITDSDALNLGLNLIPSSISYGASFDVTRDFLTNTNTNKQGSISVKVNDGVTKNVFQLDESLGKGKILVASEVFTPNGVKAQISDIQHMPIFSVDVNSNVQTQYQDLETSIAVTPTVIKFDKDKPELTTVRLDVGVKVSIVSGESRMGSVTAPQYSDKKFQTTRVFPADGKTYLVGTFVTDSYIQSRSGVPFLMRIPLLRYFFSQETTEKNRNYAVLSLAVKVIPSDEYPDKFTIPWFQRQDIPAKGKTADGKGGISRGKDSLTVPAADLQSQPQQIPADSFSSKP